MGVSGGLVDGGSSGGGLVDGGSGGFHEEDHPRDGGKFAESQGNAAPAKSFPAAAMGKARDFVANRVKRYRFSPQPLLQ